MSDRQSEAGDAGGLRAEAERRLEREQRSRLLRAPADTARLLHELQVHQVELEMQNDELRRTQVDLAESRDRFEALYDHAPVGYLTVERGGRILELNLTGVRMLGLERRPNPGLPLARFIMPKEVHNIESHLRETFASLSKQGQDVTARRQDGTGFPARLESIGDLESRAPAGRTTRCHTVLIDLSELRRTQDDLRTQKARTQTLLDTAADAIVSMDALGLVEVVQRRRRAPVRLEGGGAPPRFHSDPDPRPAQREPAPAPRASEPGDDRRPQGRDPFSDRGQPGRMAGRRRSEADRHHPRRQCPQAGRARPAGERGALPADRRADR